MLQGLPSVSDIPLQFEKLSKAIIDSSSILYMEKAGILKNLVSTLQLMTIPEVLEECGSFVFSYRLEVVASEGCVYDSTDDRLVAAAIQLQIPVISDDKRLIKKTMDSGIACYNSVMMMNYLFYCNKLSKEEIKQVRGKLLKIARYSKEVWEYGDSVFRVILEIKNRNNKKSRAIQPIFQPALYHNIKLKKALALKLPVQIAGIHKSEVLVSRGL